MLIELAREMHRLRQQLDDLEEVRKPIQARYEELRLKHIPDAMAEQDIRSLTIDGVGRLGLTADLYVSVKDKPGLYAWLNETGNESIITETINAQTLKSFLKEQMRSGAEIPDEALAITPFMRAAITKI